LLGQLQRQAPDALDYKDKLYVAHLNQGKALLDQGNRSGAAKEFAAANSVDGSRGEAQAELVALTPTPVPPTATPVPPSKAAAVYVDPRQLTSDPQSYVGKNIILQGEALNVTQNQEDKGGLFTSPHPAYTWVNLMAQVRGKNGTTESIAVQITPPSKTLLSEECYRIYGVVVGTEKVTRTLTGAENEVPEVNGYAVESAPQGAYGIGCAAP
jgi:hypothetical protein